MRARRSLRSKHTIGAILAIDANEAVDAVDASEAIDALEAPDAIGTKGDETIDASVAKETIESKRPIQAMRSTTKAIDATRRSSQSGPPSRRG